MDWTRVDFDWNRARAFLVTAEEGSFSAAARSLNTTQPTIGRQVAALESELDVVLFERVGRGLELTPTGLELLEHVRAMASHATALSRVAAGQAVSLNGPVVISAGEVIAAWVLPPIVARIRALHPGITIEIIATNQTSDLGRREADIAVRSYRPTDTALVAKKIRDDRGYLYATPEYLASIGDPTTPAELSRAEFIAFDATDVFMKGLNAMGLSLTPESFPYVCGNQHVQWALITQGAGIGVMMAAIGDADPRVQRASDDLVFEVPLWLTSHREVRTSRRVRVVFDFLAEALADDPWPNAPLVG
ncbi:MAG: LysR family transcriptional regulator [Deltaproteobacteria bacterium]|nr:LysR family transcriptional regulator [Deltaproteobacteria bacterium]